MDITAQFPHCFFHIRLAFPDFIPQLILIVAFYRQRLMIIAMQAKLSPHVKQFTTVYYEIITGRPALSGLKGTLNLIAIGFYDQSCVF